MNVPTSPRSFSQGIEHRVALVTGASSGLGAHFARVLAEAGATVIAAARRQSLLQEVVDDINASGGKAFARQLDVADPESVQTTLSEIEQSIGTVQILVNNAGIARPGSFLKQDEQALQDTLAVNLSGAWRTAQTVAERMVRTGNPGVIVNTASILGLHVGFGHSSYAVSKAAVVQMTKALALELGRYDIRVNALCPGFVVTEMNRAYFESDEGKDYIKDTPAGRVGTLDELTGPLLLLCSDAGSFINGVSLPVDGGHLIRSL